MSGVAVFRDRACQTISDYAYPIGGSGVVLTAVGFATSNVIAVMAGLFIVTITALLRYLYPSLPANNPSIHALPAPAAAPAASHIPPPAQVVPVRVKTYEEQDRAFAEGFAAYF